MCQFGSLYVKGEIFYGRYTISMHGCVTDKWKCHIVRVHIAHLCYKCLDRVTLGGRVA